ncbi:hypothetical protein J6590_102867 [Homalodisca vitripennis]|nr:hypothetical protein J6590_102867 [Homalodisca vitripennis]
MNVLIGGFSNSSEDTTYYKRAVSVILIVDFGSNTCPVACLPAIQRSWDTINSVTVWSLFEELLLSCRSAPSQTRPFTFSARQVLLKQILVDKCLLKATFSCATTQLAAAYAIITDATIVVCALHKNTIFARDLRLAAMRTLHSNVTKEGRILSRRNLSWSVRILKFFKILRKKLLLNRFLLVQQSCLLEELEKFVKMISQE